MFYNSITTVLNLCHTFFSFAALVILKAFKNTILHYNQMFVGYSFLQKT